MRRSRPFLGRLSFETSFKSLTMVVDIDTNTSAFVNSRIEAVAPALTPGLSCVVDVNIPDQNSSKIDLHYLLGILSLSTSIGVLNNPIVSVSGVLGNDVWSVGSDLAFNSNTLEVTRFNGGFSSTWDGRIVSLTLEQKCRLVKGHYYHPFSNYTIGAEWCFNVARRRSTLSFGAQLHFGGDTDVKARVNKEGVAAVYRHSWSPGSFVRLSVEKRFSQKPLFGVALVLEA